MSAQSEAKATQGYTPKPILPICGNCGHYRSDTRSYPPEVTWNRVEYTEEVSKRCALGGFAIKKTATCREYQQGGEHAE